MRNMQSCRNSNSNSNSNFNCLWLTMPTQSQTTGNNNADSVDNLCNSSGSSNRDQTGAGAEAGQEPKSGDCSMEMRHAALEVPRKEAVEIGYRDMA
ncbi:hypothetical protein AWZ03_002701 [Drosophila navojoa]|uniref:Uncharacterized protein n=1 Tax=Drosophila navojoa TaxID=7232 RepID=A0A484BR79_DRONA|nr:hypothetical protein AWZ03_002701 [Drosophila navojoa]